MLKSLTLKDFILYNSPCFMCGDKPTIYFSFESQSNPIAGSKLINPLDIKDQCFNLSLCVKYKSSLDFKVNYITHEFETSDNIAFIRFLYDNNMYLISTCHKCSTRVVSKNLTFKLNSKRLNLINLSHEAYTLIHNNIYFYIINNYRENNTNVIFDDGSKKEFNINLYPIFKFKTRHELLKKICVSAALL